MQSPSGQRLLTALESGAFNIKIVEITSLINRSTKRAFEMIFIAEDEIIAWVGCWKRADCSTAAAGAPRVWIHETRVFVFPGAGMDEGFSVEFETPSKAEHLASLLESALENAFDCINVSSV